MLHQCALLVVDGDLCFAGPYTIYGQNRLGSGRVGEEAERQGDRARVAGAHRLELVATLVRQSYAGFAFNVGGGRAVHHAFVNTGAACGEVVVKSARIGELGIQPDQIVLLGQFRVQTAIAAKVAAYGFLEFYFVF